ncbi:hypothetical protein P4639_22155 [Priestia megaterium]|uniref:hypothetical protein n=1 Tax=Priestia megaterium TaxID=1404 RepID=UPI002E236788|nr:hypothetical protein [Priestia megaterium]
MKQFTIEDLKTIKGYKAITQGEERIENMFLENVNNLRSKMKGTRKTRTDLLATEFDQKSLQAFAGLCSGVSEKKLVWNNTNIALGKDLFEKVIRTHVAEQLVPTLSEFILNRARVLSSMDEAVSSIKKYMTEGRVPKLGQMLQEAEEEIKKGEYIYHVPA